jgi:type IV pilus assembly protein PilB
VRKLCPNCRQAYRLEEETAVRLGIAEESGNIFFSPAGCNICRNLGYQGRIALQEIMLIGPELRSLISRGRGSENNLQQICLQEGMINIKTDGITKARMGVTSLEEVMKAVLIGN